MNVSVPDLGDFANVEIIELLVKVGDRIEADASILTLETDKATMDVPSPATGVVSEVKVAVGDRVSIGDPLIVLDVDSGQDEGAAADADPADPAGQAADNAAGEADSASPSDPATDNATAGKAAGAKPGGDAHKPADATAAGDGALVAAGDQGGKSRQTAANASTRNGPAASEPASAAPSRMRAAPQDNIDEAGFSRAHASPSVRKLARELGVDLGRVSGSGRKSRITADDVKGFVKEALRNGGGGGGGSGLPAIPEVDFAKFGSIETRPLSRIQRLSGRHVHASWVNIPHVTQHDEADITVLEQTRASLKNAARERGIRLTPLAFVMRACALALAEFPDFKSSLTPDGQSLVLKNYIHIGFAADTDNGLVVPVIRDADKKDIYEIAADLGRLSEQARDGKLKADDMQGGVFTVSSLGGIGGTFFTPIVNAPQVAILGVSRNQWRPVYRDGGFLPRLILPLSLSYDHRVIDGAAAVRFTTRLAEILGDADRLIEAVP